MNRRAAITAAVVVTAIFFVIRLGVRLLSKEAAPPPSSVIDRSRSTPLEPPSPFVLKGEANAKLMLLATEAREAKDTKAAVSAYAALEALRKDDCATAKSAMARASEEMAKESRAQVAREIAERAVAAYCATKARPPENAMTPRAPRKRQGRRGARCARGQRDPTNVRPSRDEDESVTHVPGLKRYPSARLHTLAQKDSAECTARSAPSLLGVSLAPLAPLRPLGGLCEARSRGSVAAE